MPNLNKVFLMGNLTRDPELRYTPSGTAVASFGLAVNRRYKSQSGEDREDTCFVEVTAFARQAEVISEYLSKGRPVFIEGRLHLDRWEDKQSGAKRSKLTVTLENFQFLGGRGEGGPGKGSKAPGSAQGGHQGGHQGGQGGQGDQGGQGGQGGQAPPVDDDIPF